MNFVIYSLQRTGPTIEPTEFLSASPTVEPTMEPTIEPTAYYKSD